MNLLFNALWIIGLAIILAGFSYASWQAGQNNIKLRHTLSQKGFQLPLTLGLVLVSLSLVLLAQSWWERAIWLVFLGLFLFQGWQLKRA